MKDPRKAFTEAEHVDASVELDYYECSPMMGGEPELDEGDKHPRGDAASRADTTSSTSVRRGTITVGADSWDVDGYGLRDHSWGPRIVAGAVLVPLAHVQRGCRRRVHGVGHREPRGEGASRRASCSRTAVTRRSSTRRSTTEWIG